MLKVVGASWSQIRLSTSIIGIVIVLGIVAIIITETGNDNDDGNYSATVFWNAEMGFEIEFWGQGQDFNEIQKGVARAHYDPHMQETGWAIFQVETQAEYSDDNQAFAAGLLEGALTWQMIYWHWQNTVKSYCDGQTTLCDNIRRFIKRNTEWVTNTAAENLQDPYWHQVNLYYRQLQGIEKGFQEGVERSRVDIDAISSTDFLWMNSFSDLPDLEEKYSEDSTLFKWHRRMNITTDPPSFDCGYRGIPLASSFIKFVPNKERLFVAHNSAGQYSHMLKMFKRYEFRYHMYKSLDAPLVPGTKLAFSSYPAAIHSMDDFYVIEGNFGHNLAITATPITIFNRDLWNHVTPRNHVLIGPRSLAANRLAKDASEWKEIFPRYNSGTGNKAWMIADLGLFDRVTSHRDDPERYSLENLKNLFWVLEQVPGAVIAEEQTELLLRTSYWASYGIPFYEPIFDVTGTRDMKEKHGDIFSYEHTNLANIFRRDQVNVTSLDTAMNLMRSNLYKIDPLTEGNPRCAVGSRGDVKGLVDAPEPEGVTDIKVLRSNAPPPPFIPVRNNTLRMQLNIPRLLIAAGPVYSGITTDEDSDDLAPFSWSDFPDVPHIGQPDKWLFEPIPISFV